MLGIFRVLLVIAVALFAAFFTMGNPVVVEVNYLFGVKNISLPLLIFIVLATGLIAGYLLASLRSLRMSRTIRRLEREIQVAEVEVNNLRSIPIKDVH